MRKQESDESSIRLHMKGSAAYGHVKELVNMTRKYIHTSGRLAGTPGDNEAIQYLKDEFQKAGIEISLDKICDLHSWIENYSSVKVTQPIYQNLTCCAVPGSGSSPEEGIEGEIVYIGRGISDEYREKDLRGKIVFHDPPAVRRTDNPLLHVLLNGLIEMGAIGVIEYSQITGRILQPRALGSYGVSIPVVCVTYEDALSIKELIGQWYAIPTGFLVTEKIPVKAQIKVKVSVSEGVTYNVVGTITGRKYPDEKVVLVAHHDGIHISPAANDNASSLGVMIELAKIFSKLPPPKRTIVFLVTAEEYGPIGANHFVKQHKDKLQNLRACIVIDLIGSGDKQLYVTENAYEGRITRSAAWLDQKLVGIAEELGYYLEASTIDYAGDNGSFQEAGVPTSSLGASLRICWPFLHTYLDDIDAIDPNRLKTMGDIVGVALWRLANAEEVKKA